MHILLLEDDLQLQESLKMALEMQNYQVHVVMCVEDAKKEDYSRYDLAILDVWLPDGSGIDVCYHIRKSSNLPIVFLTANDLEETIVEGLNAGGDDYITKPFSLNVLYARISAILRRKQSVKIADLTLDESNYRILKNGIPLSLTIIEYELMVMFFKNPRSVLTREQLLSCIEKQTGNFVEDNTLSVHIKRIKDKLGTYQGKQYIETIRGVGYRIYESNN